MRRDLPRDDKSPKKTSQTESNVIRNVQTNVTKEIMETDPPSSSTTRQKKAIRPSFAPCSAVRRIPALSARASPCESLTTKVHGASQSRKRERGKSGKMSWETTASPPNRGVRPKPENPPIARMIMHHSKAAQQRAQAKRALQSLSICSGDGAMRRQKWRRHRCKRLLTYVGMQDSVRRVLSISRGFGMAQSKHPTPVWVVSQGERSLGWLACLRPASRFCFRQIAPTTIMMMMTVQCRANEAHAFEQAAMIKAMRMGVYDQDRRIRRPWRKVASQIAKPSSLR